MCTPRCVTSALPEYLKQVCERRRCKQLLPVQFVAEVKYSSTLCACILAHRALGHRRVLFRLSLCEHFCDMRKKCTEHYMGQMWPPSSELFTPLVKWERGREWAERGNSNTYSGGFCHSCVQNTVLWDSQQMSAIKDCKLNMGHLTATTMNLKLHKTKHAIILSVN